MSLKPLFFVLIFMFLALSNGQSQEEQSIAREWNEVLLEAIRQDFARPTVHARNLFHFSIACYDAWAIYHDKSTYFLGNTTGDFHSPFDGFDSTESNTDKALNETISYACYRLIRHRFKKSPGYNNVINIANELLVSQGYSIFNVDTNYKNGSPAGLGNYIADQIIKFGMQDGSNEHKDYKNLVYNSINDELFVEQSGNENIQNFNRWQPLVLTTFIDQSGNEIPNEKIEFLGAEWGNVTPFSLTENERKNFSRANESFYLYHDPGPPAFLDHNEATNEDYNWNFALVLKWASQLDPSDGVLWDISPKSMGNISNFPSTVKDYPAFYNFENGGDGSEGYALNPSTQLPYEEQWVPRGDYTRVLAEFWADGPSSETPPGHWFTILNYVSDHPECSKKLFGEGSSLQDLEWDIMTYFALGGALHDAAIAAWSIKGYYDYIRPISVLRGRAQLGQSTDTLLPNYHPSGIPLQDGLIELVTLRDSLLVGDSLEHLNKIKFYSWAGHHADVQDSIIGVSWILAEHWWPYQKLNFVTPPFAGYVSGHSTFSRAAAEVLTGMTGDPYFPGGMGVFKVEKDHFLEFEKGPSQEMELQWATYRDASDQCSLSRIWGGIHPPIDDIPGRIIGEKIGEGAIQKFKSIIQ